MSRLILLDCHFPETCLRDDVAILIGHDEKIKIMRALHDQLIVEYPKIFFVFSPFMKQPSIRCYFININL